MNSLIKSLYLHFPYCRHLCNYCDFYKNLIDNDTDFDEFHQYLELSWYEHEVLLKENTYIWGPLETFYIGGGTPSLWSSLGADYLKTFFKEKSISLNKNCEFTLEVNPGSWSKEGLASWKELGVNRFSLGVQTLNPNVIKFLDRIHSIDDVFDTLAYFKTNELNFSVDFMLGLPNSKELSRDVLAELKEVIEKFDPPHFSIYILTVKKQYIHFEKLPDEKFLEKEYLAIANFLKVNGYNHYEVSNFAKPGFESQHNISYWKQQSVAALGPSATGYLDIGIRYKWKPRSRSFEREHLTTKELLLERVYLSLRTNLGFDWTDFTDDKKVLEKLNKVSKNWSERGLIEIKKNKLVPTSNGYLVMDGLVNELFNIEGFL